MVLDLVAVDAFVWKEFVCVLDYWKTLGIEFSRCYIFIIYDVVSLQG